MPWTIKYNTKLNIVESDFFGYVTLKDFQEESIQSLHLSQKHNTDRYIADLSKADINVSATDAFNVVEMLKMSESPLKLAIILPENKKGINEINIFKNAGEKNDWYIETFPDFQKALDWLNNL